jgi:HEAT repeat protein
MKSIRKRLLTGAFILTVALPLIAKPPETVDQLKADLDSPKEKVVYAAMQDIEKQFPTDDSAIAKLKTFLTDPRQMVRDKAARVLGALHYEVTDSELKSIAALLDSQSKNEIMEGLKALRGLKAQSVVPKIIPLLQNPDANIQRDACRTLAVIGDKSVVASIQPLLQSPDKGVVKDANDAIFTLNAK